MDGIFFFFLLLPLVLVTTCIHHHVGRSTKKGTIHEAITFWTSPPRKRKPPLAGSPNFGSRCLQPGSSATKGTPFISLQTPRRCRAHINSTGCSGGRCHGRGVYGCGAGGPRLQNFGRCQAWGLGLAEASAVSFRCLLPRSFP